MGMPEPFTDPDEIVSLPSGEKRLGDCTKEDIAQLIRQTRQLGDDAFLHGSAFLQDGERLDPEHVRFVPPDEGDA